MTDKIQQIIQEISKKHGILISRDDPVLMVHTINDFIIEDSIREQQTLLNQYKQELEVILHRWADNARELSERVLNTALASGKEAMTKVLHDSSSLVVQSIQNELSVLLKQVVRERRVTGRLVRYQLGIASVLFSVSCVLCVLSFHNFL